MSLILRTLDVVSNTKTEKGSKVIEKRLLTLAVQNSLMTSERAVGKGVRKRVAKTIHKVHV